jgi:hypothetical protein
MWKTIVLLAFVVAFGTAWNMSPSTEEKVIKFNYDLQESLPFSIYVDGQLDPRNEENNKIQAFLRLAGKYIPILESLSGKNNELKWERDWNINFLGVSLNIHGYFQLIVGWRVNPGGYTQDRFDVTYYPFVWGGTAASTTGNATLVSGEARVWLRYAYAYAPISLQLFSSGKVCFQGSYVVEPVHLKNHLYVALQECHDEIIDEVISGHFLPVWKCNAVAPVNVTAIDVNLTDEYKGDIIAQTCIDL